MSESGAAVMDAATGLPELPEGYWWSVEKETEGLFYYRPYEYFVAIKKTVVEPEKRVRRDGFLGWFGGTRVVAETRTEQVAASYGITDEDGLAVRDLTPEVIRAVAVTVLEDLEKSRMTASLLGAYPPKVLA